MSKYKVPNLQEDGSSQPVYPVMDRPYKMQCCDCGLVHDLQFYIERESNRKNNGEFDTELVEDKTLRVMFVVSRNNRATAQIRRHRRKV